MKSVLQSQRRRLLWVAGISIFGASLTATACLLPVSGGPPWLFVNLSASMPLGLYLLSHGKPEAGSLVIFPSTAIPSCGIELPKYLLKRVIAAHGEAVTIDRSGLSIGGKLIAPRVKDIGVHFSGKLARNEVLVLGENPRSFDSRYFGPVKRKWLSTVTPVVAW